MKLTTQAATIAASLGLAAASQAAVTTGLIAYYDFETDITDKSGSATNHDGSYLRSTSIITGTGAGWDPSASGSDTYDGAQPGTTDRSTALIGNALNVAKSDTVGVNAGLSTANSGPGVGQFTVSTLTTDGAGGGTLGNSFTISVWFYHAPDPQNTGTVNGSLRDSVFQSVGTWDATFETNSNDGTTYASYVGQGGVQTNTVASNGWHHVLQTFDSDGTTTTMTVYIDGVANASTTSNTTASVDFDGINFGAHRSGDRIFDGMLDEVAVWDRVLDSSEALAVYNGGTNGVAVTSIPEPSSAALLGLGGLALMLRRRK